MWTLFRKCFLRSSTRIVWEVIRSQRIEDAYLGPQGSDLNGKRNHLDHVIECQMVAAIFGKLNFSLPNDKKKTIAVLHDIANDRKNLRLTAMWANMVKEVAVKEFLCDWQTRQANLSLADYLSKAAWVDKQINTKYCFDKAQVHRLCSVMTSVMQWFLDQIQSKIRDFPSDKIYHDVEKVATDVCSAMKLKSKKVSKSTEIPDKPKTSSKTRVAKGKTEEKVKEKRRVRKTREEEDVGLQKVSSKSIAADDMEEKHAVPKTHSAVVANDTRSKMKKAASAELQDLAQETASKISPKKSSRRSTTERSARTAGGEMAPSSPPTSTTKKSVSVTRSGHTVEPADKPRARARLSKESA